MPEVLQGKISCPCQKVKSDSHVIQSVAHLPYRVIPVTWHFTVSLIM